MSSQTPGNAIGSVGCVPTDSDYNSAFSDDSQWLSDLDDSGVYVCGVLSDCTDDKDDFSESLTVGKEVTTKGEEVSHHIRGSSWT